MKGHSVSVAQLQSFLNFDFQQGHLVKELSSGKFHDNPRNQLMHKGQKRKNPLNSFCKMRRKKLTSTEVPRRDQGTSWGCKKKSSLLVTLSIKVW